MDRRVPLALRLLTCATVLLVGLAFAQNAYAQAQARITGTVVDNVGVVPGVTVTITNASLGITRTAVTNAQGVFEIPSLVGANYTLKTSMEGFKEITMQVPLNAGENRDLGKLTLQAGGRTETVNVTAEVTPVQTTTSALQKNLTGDLLTSVQVKGRDVFGILKVLPGVADANPSRDFAQWNSGRYLSINGGNSLNKNTTIDGIPSGEEGGNGTTHITPNIDSVAEVNVIASGYTAENGRQASGQIIMVTKSGTNQLKGSGWYNYRRDWMNKNEFFRIKQGLEKPYFAVNIGGFSIGGPVVIPGLVDSRTSEKKTFFFGSTELTQDLRPTPATFTNLPTARERAGDFTQTFTGKATGDTHGNFASGSQQPTAILNPQGFNNFYCAAGTGGISGVACNPTNTRTNIINPAYFNPLGVQMLNLLPMPNGITNQAADQFNNSNDRQDITPLHTRKNFVVRVDQVLSNKVRFSGRMLIDKDDSTTYNAMSTNVGSIDNIYNGAMMAGAMTWVVRPTIVNEITSGYTYDNYGFLYKPGKLTSSDYTQWYRNAYNPIINQNLPDPPRLAPYPANKLTTDPLSLLKTNCLDCNSDQSLQQPYFPDISFSGGNRSNYSYFRPSGGSGPLPRQNYNPRFTFQDDLSIVKSRHSFKFGFSMERNAKTEPGGSVVSGSYNFGSTTANPLDTGFGTCPSATTCGNGYANALLGVFQQYQELDYRVDREDVHWLGEGYAQDTWRVTPRLTLDLGIRFTHNGSMFEINNYNSGFDPNLYNASQAAELYKPFCSPSVPNTSSCSSSNQFAYDPRYPINGALPTGGVNKFSRNYVGIVVPGTGVGNYGIANGFFQGGLPGKKPGEYDSLQWMNYGPRFGFAWDVFGDGKTAIRGATGIFYNFFSCCNYPYNGGPQLSVTRSILNSTFSDITQAQASGNLAVSPAGSGIPRDLGAFNYLKGQDLQPGPFQTSRHYQANFAVQRDIGFSTVVEVAYVGNFGRHYYQQKSVNNIPVDAYADPNNLFSADAINSNFIRRDFKGVGGLNYVTSDYDGLNYNSLQISVQRRLSHGFQMGGAYTLAKGQGMRGWDFRTEEIGGAAALRQFYYGPIAVNAESLATDQGQERRHVGVINYSYQIPAINKPVLKYVLGGWEASGVTTIVTGDAVNPVCNNNSSTSGIANSDPSLSGVGTRCELVPGQSIGDLSAFNTSGVLVEDQMHYNVNALQRPYPTNTAFKASNNVAGVGAVGNVGNFPYGGLRNPGWWNWDFTLGRRIPVKMGSRSGNARLQLQFYNLFNQVEFSRVGGTYSFASATATGFGGGNSNNNTGKYTTAQNPYNFSITIRFDY